MESSGQNKVPSLADRHFFDVVYRGTGRIGSLRRI